MGTKNLEPKVSSQFDMHFPKFKANQGEICACWTLLSHEDTAVE